MKDSVMTNGTAVRFGRLADGTIIPDDNPRALTLDERDLMQHVIRWGSDGYPIVKFGRSWGYLFRSVRSGALYSTRRKAVAEFEAYYDLLLYLSGQHSRLAAIAAQAVR